MQKSLEQMLKDYPWILEIGANEIPRDHQGIYLDLDENTGKYKYPQSNEQKKARRDRRKYDYEGETGGLDEIL